MTVHAIRLAGPWQRYTAAAEPVRVTLPCHTPGDAQPSSLDRKFHRPSGLTDQSEVVIVITADTASLDVTINDQQVSEEGHRDTGSWVEVSFRVTPLLKSFNSLSIRCAERIPLTLHSVVIRIHEQGPANQ